MKITHTSDYNEKRKQEYPPLADYADAMYWASKGDNAKLEQYLAKIEQVKLKYPKPVKQEG